MIFYILSGIAGYLVGSINTSIIVGKAYGLDIRSKGSGNAGMTNTLRTLGKKAAVFVLAGDVLKGVIAYFIGYLITGAVIGGIISGGAAVIGHNWPVYFGFKGGKGALTSITVLFLIDWRISLIALIFFIFIVFITKFVSLGSILAAMIIPVLVILFKGNIELLIFSIILACMTVIKHKTNIKRLLDGTESKLSRGKKE
jgi:glycerol-3-phosphate acyltransferase PlsY